MVELLMGEVYTFTRYPGAVCHLCGNKKFKYIWGHIRGKEHKRNYKAYLAGRKTLDKIMSENK